MQIAVLDYDKGAVYIYDLTSEDTKVITETDGFELFISNKGHRNFDWFFSGEKIPIIVNGMARSGF